MAPTGKAANRNAPVVLHRRVYRDARFEDGHLLHRTHDDAAALEPLAHEVFVLASPSFRAGGSAAYKFDGKSDEFIGKHSAADQARIVMIEVANSDRSAGTHVVVNIGVEQSNGAGVGVSLQISPYPVIAIAQAGGKNPALRIEQEPSRFVSSARHDDEIGRLLVEMIILIEVGDSRDVPSPVGENFFRHAICLEFAVACRQGSWNDRILRSVLGIYFAGKAHAPSAAHARCASSVSNGVSQHRNMKRVKSETSSRWFKDGVFPIGLERRHGKRTLPWRAENVIGVVSGNSDFPFGLFVIGL